MKIHLTGSYGEYYDFMGQPRGIILCRLCANHLHNLLMEKFGIDPYGLELEVTLGEQLGGKSD